MADTLKAEELELAQKALATPNGLTSKEEAKLKVLNNKSIHVGDALNLIRTQFPIASVDELDLASRLIESQGTLKLSDEEKDLLEAAGDKRASLQDVIEVVMSAYKGTISNQMRDIRDQLFLLQILFRDFAVSNSAVKKLARKLSKTGDLSDAGFRKIMSANLKLTEDDFKVATKTREDAYTNMVDTLNQQSELLEKVQSNN